MSQRLMLKLFNLICWEWPGEWPWSSFPSSFYLQICFSLFLHFHRPIGQHAYRRFSLAWAFCSSLVPSRPKTQVCLHTKKQTADSSVCVLQLQKLSIADSNVCVKSEKSIQLIKKKKNQHLLLVAMSRDMSSEPRLLNLILINSIVRWPTERSHYVNNLWNATFGLWKIIIMNGWMVSFEWKTSKHHENRELVATLSFYYESLRR